MTMAFLGRNYCDSTTWFTSWEKSWLTQGNESGTAHPNAAGHVAYGNLLRKAIVLDQGRQAYRNLTVRIEALKAAPLAGAAARNVDMTLWEFQNDLRGLTRYVSVPRNGTWTAVPAAVGTFTIPMFVAPASPRHATQLSMVLARILPIQHTRSDAYGAGPHELVHPTGSLAVRYSVVSTTPLPGAAGIG
jgi:hypothetical protein